MNAGLEKTSQPWYARQQNRKLACFDHLFGRPLPGRLGGAEGLGRGGRDKKANGPKAKQPALRRDSSSVKDKTSGPSSMTD